MAMRGNSSSIGMLGGQVIGGGAVHGLVFNQLPIGRKRNIYFGGVSNVSSVPYGYRPPYSVLLAPKNGACNARSSASLTGSGTANEGRYIDASGSAELVGAGSITGIGNLVASGSAELVGALLMSAVVNMTASGTGTLTGAGEMSAVVFMTASGTATLTGAGNLNGLADIIASGSALLTGAGLLNAGQFMTASGSAALVGVGSMTGIGNMTASNVEEVAEMTEETIAEAVWAAIASVNDDPDSMGEKLIEASDQWAKVLTAGGWTAGDMMRLMSAVAGGRSTRVYLGGNSYTITFESIDDDAKIVVDADMTGSERVDVIRDMTF